MKQCLLLPINLLTELEHIMQDTDLLSEHFTYGEAVRSATATRLGINNTPDDTQLSNMKVQAVGMELVRGVLGFPIHVDSWLRVEALEKIITQPDFIHWCGEHFLDPMASASWQAYFIRKAHPKGFGTDFYCPQFGAPSAIVTAIQASGIKVDECIMEGTWVHVSFDPQMRGLYMLATFTNGVPSYTQLS